MPDQMINMRRSPRKLLERDGHPGPGPGHLALVLARAGVGKTAFVVDVGMDALLAGQKVLHVTLDSTVEKVRAWYDDILTEILRRDKKLDRWAPIQLDVERRRHIHAYVGDAFTVERLRAAVELLRDVMHFEPQVVIVDGLEPAAFTPETVSGVKALMDEIKAELWVTCQIRREGPQGEPGHLPPPADGIEELVDLALRLDPQESKIRLHALKDQNKMLDEDLHIVLDPQTLLINVSFGTGS